LISALYIQHGKEINTQLENRQVQYKKITNQKRNRKKASREKAQKTQKTAGGVWILR